MYTGRSHVNQSSPSTDDGNTAAKSSTNKVDFVCELVKSAVEKIDADRWVTGQITLCPYIAFWLFVWVISYLLTFVKNY